MHVLPLVESDLFEQSEVVFMCMYGYAFAENAINYSLCHLPIVDQDESACGCASIHYCRIQSRLQVGARK